MIVQSFDISHYVQVGDQAVVGIRLADQTFFEGGVTVREIHTDHLVLELLGAEWPAAPLLDAGGIAMLTKTDSRILCRCHVALTAPVCAGLLQCQVVDYVEVQQRREFFRMDVNIPLQWHVAEEQRLSDAVEHWSLNRISVQGEDPPRLAATANGGFRVLNWRNNATLEPQSLNLSGGGIRCMLPRILPVGTLINLELFLPLTPGRVIHVVGIVVRSNELQLSTEPAFMTGIRFVHLADCDRETIISYIFNEQRSHMRAFAEAR